MKEPKAANTLANEAERLEEEVRSALPSNLPETISSLFGPMSSFFEEEIISQWRIAKRFDELIQYYTYQFEEFDGDAPWGQVLLDLRLSNEYDRALEFLELLYRKRYEVFDATREELKSKPEDAGLAVECALHKASVLKVLGEIEFIVKNRPEETRDKEAIKGVNDRIHDVLGILPST